MSQQRQPDIVISSCIEIPKDDDISQYIDKSTNLPPKDDLVPVGCIYTGMGTYACIYQKDDRYTYWTLGGPNGYHAELNWEDFQKCTSYEMHSWKELKALIGLNETIIQVVSETPIYNTDPVDVESNTSTQE